MKILVARFNRTDKSTAGDIYIDTMWHSFVLEDPVREQFLDGEWVWKPEFKIPKKTAIPSGTYPLIVDFSQRFQRELPHILDVPDFTGVRFHPGNEPVDTEGCPLPGRVWNSENPNWISQSRLAFDPLFQVITEELGGGGEISVQFLNDFGVQH